MEMVLPSKTPVSMRTVPTEGEVCWGGSLYVISGPMEGRKLLRIEDEVPQREQLRTQGEREVRSPKRVLGVDSALEGRTVEGHAPLLDQASRGGLTKGE